MDGWKLNIGAAVLGGGDVRFRVWAPKAGDVSVRLITGGKKREFQLKRGKDDYFEGVEADINPGDWYFYVLNGNSAFPDPASRYQPEGVHGPSQIIDPAEFQWNDIEWRGLPLNEFVIYELHIGTFTGSETFITGGSFPGSGTFTGEGKFEDVVAYLDYFKEFGVTAIEIMPVAQFPGNRNWGYDGVFPFAPQNSYGTPKNLKFLINACHNKGLAVILDVVYNHLGPEGNYLNNFGHYFTDKYKTPWGDAINYDGPDCEGARRYFIDNALYWVTEYHIDALRIDAIHGIFDFGARHFLKELGEEVHRQAEYFKRDIHVIAESDLNDARVIDDISVGGYGLDVVWNDDFHHCIHTLLTGEKSGYYQDFGKLAQLEKAVKEGFVYSGQYSEFRKRRHGNSSAKNPAEKFIIFSQNHDQIGNRAKGDRLAANLSAEKLKLATGIVMLSPYIPLMFMGEEYGETAPFSYFVSHSDEALINAVRDGRVNEFVSYGWDAENIPDPQAESTFKSSRINLELRYSEGHKEIFAFYKQLLRIRNEQPALHNLSKDQMEVTRLSEYTLFVRRWHMNSEIFCLYNFNEKDERVETAVPAGIWNKLLSSAGEPEGVEEDIKLETTNSSNIVISLSAFSFVLYGK